MPALLEVMGLAAVAFLASALISRDQRRAGAPGIYVLVGLLIGPVGMGLLDDDSQRLLRPVLSLCVTWLGLRCGMRVFDRRGPGFTWRLGSAALLEAGGVIAVVALGLYLLGPAFGFSPTLAETCAAGIAIAASSHAAVEVFRGRLGPTHPTFTFLEAVSSLDALVPILALWAFGLFQAPPHLAQVLGAAVWGSAICTLALGLLAGLIFLLAVGRRETVDRGWVILLGVLFLSAGVADQLGLPELLVGAVAGAVMAVAPGGRLMISGVASTERPVALLVALLVGTRIGASPLLLLAVLAIGLRLVWNVAAGALLGPLGPGGRGLGLGLLSCGGFALAVAVQLDLLYGGAAGGLALTAAGGLCLIGDTLGTIGLLTTLRSRGELLAAEGPLG